MTTEAPPDRVLNYAFLLGGIAALIFGVILLFRQDEALSLLMILLGLWWLIQGAFMLFAVFVDSTDAGWKIAGGLLGVVAGILVLANPGTATDVFQGVIGIILGIIGILVGLAALFGAFRGGGIGAGVFGLVSIAIGILVVLNGQFTTEFLVTIFGALLVIDGISGVYLAIKYK